MPKINLAIEADSATEMKEILSQLATGSVVEVTQSLNTANKKATEEVEKKKQRRKNLQKRKRRLRRKKKKFLRPQPQTPNHRKLGRKSCLLIQKQKRYQQQPIYIQGQQKQMYKQQ
ncbi:hypothetical protein EfsSVR2281_07160 [Enterococcus faecalis]|nr:hypothetical protein EfsSVR2281_07160 [Enterococcus faecalis]